MTVQELANELGKKLQESKQFQDMVTANEARLSDDIASAMLEKFNKAREEISMRAANPNITKEEMMKLRNEMQHESDKLMNNSVIATYFEACQDFEEVMQEVNQIIGSYIAPQTEGGDGCGGDCDGGCSGCH